MISKTDDFLEVPEKYIRQNVSEHSPEEDDGFILSKFFIIIAGFRVLNCFLPHV